jgi:hypothetical protein
MINRQTLDCLTDLFQIKCTNVWPDPGSMPSNTPLLPDPIVLQAVSSLLELCRGPGLHDAVELASLAMLAYSYLLSKRHW